MNLIYWAIFVFIMMMIGIVLTAIEFRSMQRTESLSAQRDDNLQDSK
tara:strand:- start:273 stop:413 length:141 start_codon:yes stop_codon:yes gene_type:complete